MLQAQNSCGYKEPWTFPSCNPSAPGNFSSTASRASNKKALSFQVSQSISFKYIPAHTHTHTNTLQIHTVTLAAQPGENWPAGRGDSHLDSSLNSLSRRNSQKTEIVFLSTFFVLSAWINHK